MLQREFRNAQLYRWASRPLEETMCIYVDVYIYIYIYTCINIYILSISL